MGRRSFAARNETFGLDTAKPWALPALRLLFHVPRAYAPLVDAWEKRFPGTKRSLDRLVEMGFAEFQGPVVIDTRTAEMATSSTRKVARFRTTSRGRRFLTAVEEDFRVFEDHFPNTSHPNALGAIRLLAALNLEGSHARYGLSAAHAVELSGLAVRSGRWWLARLRDLGHIRELPERHADVREVIPAHWRVTRSLCRQLSDVLDSFPAAPAALRVEFRLSRTRFNGDIDPARVGISGATDFDHDIEAQRILAALLGSERCAPDGLFTIEPRLNLPIDMSPIPWVFTEQGSDMLFYQPDAVITEREMEDGRATTRRGVIEYERYQSRRDAWNHIERFLGWLHTMTMPFEAAALRFVVDSEPRVRSYVQLIEAFCDYALDHPEALPRNPVMLAVSSAPRLLEANDPLARQVWHRLELPRPGADTAVRAVLHDPDHSPYDDYFARS